MDHDLPKKEASRRGESTDAQTVQGSGGKEAGSRDGARQADGEEETRAGGGSRIFLTESVSP